MSDLIDKNLFLSLLSNELENNRELMLKLFDIFVEYASGLTELQFNESADGLNNIRENSHRLLASSRSFGAMVLADRLLDLEIAIKTSQFENLESKFDLAVKTCKLSIEELSGLIKDIAVDRPQSA